MKTKEEIDAEDTAAKDAAAPKASRSKASAKESSAPSVPEVLLEAAPALIKLAEQLMQGPGRGPEKKRFVRDALKALARAHDWPQVPDLIEHPLEDALVEGVVQFVFITLPGMRKTAEQKAA